MQTYTFYSVIYRLKQIIIDSSNIDKKMMLLYQHQIRLYFHALAHHSNYLDLLIYIIVITDIHESQNLMSTIKNV